MYSRAVGDRATEPRVAPLKMNSSTEDLKEMHLKKIKPKTETKPILQSLRDGIGQLKKTTVRERSETRHGSCSGNGFLDRISKLTHGSRSRNPAKKSASFTFAVRPELAMKAQERYSSLEPETSQNHSNVHNSKLPVQRSVSTSVLEVSADVEVQPNYSRVRDSLTPLPSPPKQTKQRSEDIYAEICENFVAEVKSESKEKSERIEGKAKIQRQSRVQKSQIQKRLQIQSQNEIKSEVEFKSQTKIQPLIQSRFQIEIQPEIQPRFQIETQPEIKPRFQFVTHCQPEIKPRSKIDTQPEIKPRFQIETQPEIQPRFHIETEPQINPRFQIHPQQKNPGSHVMARIKIIVKSKESYESEQVKKEGRYVNSVMITHSDPIINTDDNVIYNSIF